MNSNDKLIVRELAKKYMALVCSEKQAKMFERFRATNDLKLVRPPVLIDEIPWYQMDIDGELSCRCEDKSARDVELHFRKAIYYMTHFKVDNLWVEGKKYRITYDKDGIEIIMNRDEIK